MRNRDMPRARGDHPAWLDPANDEPIEDKQVNEVEDEKHAEGIGEEFPEGAASQGPGSPKQCQGNGSPDEQAEQDRHSLFLLRFGRDDLSDLLRAMPYEYAGIEPQQDEQVCRSDNRQQGSISHDAHRI